MDGNFLKNQCDVPILPQLFFIIQVPPKPLQKGGKEKKGRGLEEVKETQKERLIIQDNSQYVEVTTRQTN